MHFWNYCPRVNVIDTKAAFRYFLLMIRRLVFAISILVALAGFRFLPDAGAQVPLRRLTTTGDVMEFAWSPHGDALYVTRRGKMISLDATRGQQTGDLFRVNITDATSQMLAQNANSTRTPIAPQSTAGDEIAFTRLNADGTARVIIYNPSVGQELNVGEIPFGAVPQWNRQGATLFYVQDGKLRRATQNQRETMFEKQTFPVNRGLHSRPIESGIALRDKVRTC